MARLNCYFFTFTTQRDLFADVSKERRAVVITIGNYVKPKSVGGGRMS